MAIDKKILKEIQRHHRINNYISEQAAGNIVPGLEGPTEPEDNLAAANWNSRIRCYRIGKCSEKY